MAARANRGTPMNKTALITGATGGLGTSVAERFLADGWRVVAPARSAAPDPESDRNPALQIVEGDLTDAAAVQGVVAHAAGKAEAPLQAVVNLVGGYAGGARVHETPIENFERQFTANLRPTYLVTQAALPHLRPGAAIVCVSSRAALQPFSGAAGYIATPHNFPNPASLRVPAPGCPARSTSHRAPTGPASACSPSSCSTSPRWPASTANRSSSPPAPLAVHRRRQRLRPLGRPRRRPRHGRQPAAATTARRRQARDRLPDLAGEPPAKRRRRRQRRRSLHPRTQRPTDPVHLEDRSRRQPP